MDVHFEEVQRPGGEFLMGDPQGDPSYDQIPQHRVKLTRPFAIMTTPVTVALYRAVTVESPFAGRSPKAWHERCLGSSNTHSSNGDLLPVGAVSFFDALRFCNILSKLRGLDPAYKLGRYSKGENGEKTEVSFDRDANGWRLPTEAEWEYAARAGEDFKYPGSDNVDEVAWYQDNSDLERRPVAQKKPNAWGLYDMSGNVTEWTWDWFGNDFDTETLRIDPSGPPEGTYRVARGGDCFGADWACDLKDRAMKRPGTNGPQSGLRAVRNL